MSTGDAEKFDGELGGDASRTLLSRRTVMKGAAWVVPAVALASAAPAYALSCVSGKFNTQARGRMVNGQLLGLNLDNESDTQLVAVQGAFAKVAPPASQEKTGALNVQVLNALTLPLASTASTLSDILSDIAPANTGVVNEYAWAYEGGDSSTTSPAKYSPVDEAEAVGASGLVSNSGDVNFAGTGGSFPDFATLDLKTILRNSAVTSNSVTGPLVQPLVDSLTGSGLLSLTIGALAGRAYRKLNCVPAGSTGSFGQLKREYLVAGLTLRLEPGQASVLDDLSTALTDIQTTVNTNLNTQAALSELLTGLLGEIGSIAAGILKALGAVGVTANLTIDTSYLQTPIPASSTNPVMQINLGSAPKSITIDLARAAGVGYAASSNPPYLNTQQPNTKLFVDTGVTTATDATTSLVNGLVQGLLKDWLGKAVKVNVALTLTTLVTGTSDVLTVTGNLNDLKVSLISSAITLPTGADLGLTTVVADTVNAALKGFLDNALSAAVQPLLMNLFTALVNVVTIRLNAQNSPVSNNDPSTGAGHLPEPASWSNLAPTGSAKERYDVAALGVSILEVPQVLDLFLARGSVGPVNPA